MRSGKCVLSTLHMHASHYDCRQQSTIVSLALLPARSRSASSANRLLNYLRVQCRKRESGRVNEKKRKKTHFIQSGTIAERIEEEIVFERISLYIFFCTQSACDKWVCGSVFIVGTCLRSNEFVLRQYFVYAHVCLCLCVCRCVHSINSVTILESRFNGKIHENHITRAFFSLLLLCVCVCVCYILYIYFVCH